MLSVKRVCVVMVPVVALKIAGGTGRAKGVAVSSDPRSANVMGRNYLTKLRYDASASISRGPNSRATMGIGDPGVE
jgi:hypothetical protein